MKTAVEWLVKEIPSIDWENSYWKNRIEQAKELEKQQIIEFTSDFIDKHTFGDYDGNVQKNKSVEWYYNETFNK